MGYKPQSIHEINQEEFDQGFAELMRKIETKEVRLSFSSLSQFAKSPSAFVKYKMKRLLDIKPTPAMMFGSLVHLLVLNPEDFKKEVLVVPTIDKRTKAGKQEWLEFVEANPDMDSKILTDEKELKRAQFLKDSLFRNRAAASFLNEASQTEGRMEWTQNGWGMVGYYDAKGPVGEWTIDLKVVPDADHDVMRRAIPNNKLYLQGSTYQFGMVATGQAEHFPEHFIIAIDGAGEVSVNQVKEEFLDYGREELQLILKDFTVCAMKGRFGQSCDFYGDRAGVHKVEKPGWMPSLFNLSQFK